MIYRFRIIEDGKMSTGVASYDVSDDIDGDFSVVDNNYNLQFEDINKKVSRFNYPGYFVRGTYKDTAFMWLGLEK